MRLEPKFDGVGGNMKDLNIVAFRLIVGFCLVGLASCAVSPESTSVRFLSGNHLAST